MLIVYTIYSKLSRCFTDIRLLIRPCLVCPQYCIETGEAGVGGSGFRLRGAGYMILSSQHTGRKNMVEIIEIYGEGGCDWRAFYPHNDMPVEIPIEEDLSEYPEYMRPIGGEWC